MRWDGDSSQSRGSAPGRCGYDAAARCITRIVRIAVIRGSARRIVVGLADPLVDRRRRPVGLSRAVMLGSRRHLHCRRHEQRRDREV